MANQDKAARLRKVVSHCPPYEKLSVECEYVRFN